MSKYNHRFESMDFDLSANFEIANSIIGGDSDYEVPDETFLNIDVENLLGSTKKGKVKQTSDNVLKVRRFNVASDEDVQNTLKRRIPKNTRSNTAFAVNTFQDWSQFRNQQKETIDDPMGKYIL